MKLLPITASRRLTFGGPVDLVACWDHCDAECCEGNFYFKAVPHNEHVCCDREDARFNLEREDWVRLLKGCPEGMAPVVAHVAGRYHLTYATAGGHGVRFSPTSWIITAVLARQQEK